MENYSDSNQKENAPFSASAKGPKILITGAGGFIGGHLVEEAIRRGYTTWAGVRPTTSREYLQQPELQFIDLCFSQRDRLVEQLQTAKEMFGGWDYIIHNLGLTKESRKGDFERVNHQFVQNFVSALQAADCVPRQFILMSSLAAYGVGDESGREPLKLTDTPRPNTAYGRSKLRAERFLMSQQELPWTILRPTGVYGPREKDYFLMIKTIQMGLDFAVGFSPQWLTFIYVKDLVWVVFAAIEKRAVGKHYFVSEGPAYSGADFRRFVMEALPKRCVIPITLPLVLIKIVSLCAQYVGKIIRKPSTLNKDKYRIMRQRNWRCDITPLKNDLGFEPKYPLHKGVKEAIEWYKAAKWI